jgi:hypothetical protein
MEHNLLLVPYHDLLRITKDSAKLEKLEDSRKHNLHMGCNLIIICLLLYNRIC